MWLGVTLARELRTTIRGLVLTLGASVSRSFTLFRRGQRHLIGRWSLNWCERDSRKHQLLCSHAHAFLYYAGLENPQVSDWLGDENEFMQLFKVSSTEWNLRSSHCLNWLIFDLRSKSINYCSLRYLINKLTTYNMYMLTFSKCRIDLDETGSFFPLQRSTIPPFRYR